MFNLSSIVVIATVDGHRLLLTGDARGDDIFEGLAATGELGDDGLCRVDVLKLPHHGSSRNVEADFFTSSRARHYVVSGDGHHGNPESESLELLLESRRHDDEPWTLWLTYGGTPGDGRDGLGIAWRHCSPGGGTRGSRSTCASARPASAC